MRLSSITDSGEDEQSHSQNSDSEALLRASAAAESRRRSWLWVRVAVNYSSDRISAERLTQVIIESGSKAFAILVDGPKAADVEPCSKKSIPPFGRLDILVKQRRALPVRGLRGHQCFSRSLQH
jgi:hypothetical protein